MSQFHMPREAGGLGNLDQCLKVYWVFWKASLSKLTNSLRSQVFTKSLHSTCQSSYRLKQKKPSTTTFASLGSAANSVSSRSATFAIAAATSSCVARGKARETLKRALKIGMVKDKAFVSSLSTYETFYTS